MVLNGHGSTKYGIPFPVLARSAFGVRGANVPAIVRGLVACGWFGLQTSVGGNAIYALLNSTLNGALSAPVVAWLGLSITELACFFAFWIIEVVVILKGKRLLFLLTGAVIWLVRAFA